MYIYDDNDEYDGAKNHVKKNNKSGKGHNKNNEGYFLEKSKKQKRRQNQYRDKERYDDKYDGWN